MQGKLATLKELLNITDDVEESSDSEE